MASEVPETMQNLCGTVLGNYMITDVIDDPVKRDYVMYEAYNHLDNGHDDVMQIWAASLEATKRRWAQSMAMTVHVLSIVKGPHFPELRAAGRVKRLVFGADGVQDMENDPEFLRPVLLLNMNVKHMLVSSILSYTPTKALPVELALNLGMGMTRALGALFQAGFIHRLVSPHSFLYPVPPTCDTLVNRLKITDFSLCMPFPFKPRARVRFVGTMRYSAISVHECRDQGPSTDVISLIYVVAEMISGKLPWRSLLSLHQIKDSKEDFIKTETFKRLPRELRQLYKAMMEAYPQTPVDYLKVQQAFRIALKRKDPGDDFELPSWLVQPCAD